MKITEKDWEQYAKTNPYWAVLTSDEFKSENLTESNRKRFFETGEQHIHQIIHSLRDHCGLSAQTLGTSLDFGCGVGRLLVPLARISKKAIGIDVSETMRRICKENCDRFDIFNVELYGSDARLSALEPYAGKVDLITSLLVFQHIPVKTGLSILARLLRLLRTGGFGSLHLTFANEIKLFSHEAGNLTGEVFSYYQRLGDGVVKLVSEESEDFLGMQMNHYNMTEVICMLHRYGVTAFYSQIHNMAGHMSVQFFFRKG